MAAPRPARPKPLDWATPSHLTVFLRNLKLLNLHQREDWPDITLRSLSPSSQNQRQRIRLIEWALYYLFTIWDDEGARNKLRPFFPPLEPLQSVNLRAALFRALSELKKNGDLGRETILRKTMLDDCKGEKLNEVLAVFSSAVLGKMVAISAEDMIWNPAMKLSTATSISPTDYQNLVPFILAHQVSLNAAGVRRHETYDRYDRFSQLLDEKKIELVERANTEQESHQDLQVDLEILARELRTNWLGSEEWATALLDGGSKSSTDAFLELPFSQAWARAKPSTARDLVCSDKADLVNDLETRVRRLRSRVRRWHDFNESLSGERGNISPTKKKSEESRLLFRDHRSLTVASISKAVRKPEDRERVLKDADQSQFMSTVNQAIAQMNGKTRSDANRSMSGAEPVDTEPLSPQSQAREDQSPLPTTQIDANESLPSEDNQETSASVSPPVVRLSPDLGHESSDEPESEPMKPRSSSSYTLVERTRKSMSLFPPNLTQETHSRPRKHRGPRPSFPVNQFETPRKSSTQSRPSAGRSGASTPQDKLFDEDPDYASVFKSRPRVALSPISSPAVHMDPDEEFDLDYDYADYGDVDSPLAASQVRR